MIRTIRKAIAGKVGSTGDYCPGWHELMRHLHKVSNPRYQRLVEQNIKTNHNKSGKKWSMPKNWKD